MKKSVFSFVLISIIFMFSCCKSVKKAESQTINSSQHFSVVQATISTWIGGQPGIKGATFNITIDNPTIELDSLYFKNLSAKLEKDTISKQNMFIGNFTFSKHEDYILDRDSTKEYGNPAPDISLKNIFNLKSGEAIITYQFKGRTFYKKITNFTEVKKESL